MAARALIRTRGSSCSATASSALRTRLRMTCSSWTAWPSTQRSGATSFSMRTPRGLDLAFEQEQRAVDGAVDQDRLGVAGLALAREGLEMAGDAGHAIGQAGDQVEIAGHLPEVAALGENLRARHEGADRRQRLVDLVRERGRHLAERRELAGLHQLILRRAQARLRPAVLVDLGLQRRVRVAQFAGALGDLDLEPVSGVPLGHIGTVPLQHVEQRGR